MAAFQNAPVLKDKIIGNFLQVTIGHQCIQGDMVNWQPRGCTIKKVKWRDVETYGCSVRDMIILLLIMSMAGRKRRSSETMAM